MTRSPDGRLAEWENKGTRDGNLRVAENRRGDRQGSKKKNKARADLMAQQKAKKIGIPSNRQGGAYTQDEIDLWNEVFFNDGYKDHISVHTRTETGESTVIARDGEGMVLQTLDKFKIDNFDAYKKAIENHFRDLTK
jgi:hypothetical protein